MKILRIQIDWLTFEAVKKLNFFHIQILRIQIKNQSKINEFTPNTN